MWVERPRSAAAVSECEPAVRSNVMLGALHFPSERGFVLPYKHAPAVLYRRPGTTSRNVQPSGVEHWCSEPARFRMYVPGPHARL